MKIKDTTHATALALANDGIPVFPVKEDKKPRVKWSEDASTDLTTIEGWMEKWPATNLGMPTGAASGIWVLDVDVKKDAKGEESLRRLEALLGEFETYTVRTPSGGKHFYFKYGKSTNLRNLGGIFDGIDVRGEGGYVLIPPSVIDGKQYEVLEDDAIKAAPPLLKVFLEYGQKILPPKMKEGTRNETLFRYLCSLRERGVSPDHQRKIAIRVAESCGLPEEEALQCLESAEGYRDDSKAPPASEADRQAIVEEFNSKYAATWFGSDYLVLAERLDPLTGHKDVVVTDIHALRQASANKTLPKAAGGVETYADIWWRSPQRREYEGVVFTPGRTPEGYYNLWRGYGCEPKKGDCSLYKKHVLEVIASNDKAVYEYIMCWSACLIQNPAKRAGTALVLRGRQGVGKGRFANHLGMLLGQHYLPVSNMKHLVGHFNAHLKDKCLVLADEAVWEGQGHTAEGVLKAMITEDTLLIEAKGRDSIKVHNNIWLIIASNHANPVKTDSDQRRFVILDVSDEYMQDREYFDALEKQMANGGREALLYELLHYDTSKVDLQRIPQTAALQEMVQMGLSDIEAFWMEKLEEGHITEDDPEWPEWISTQELYRAYCRCLGKSSRRDRPVETRVGIAMKKLLPRFRISKKKRGKKQVRGYELPNLARCRKHFNKVMRMQQEWE